MEVKFTSKRKKIKVSESRLKKRRTYKLMIGLIFLLVIGSAFRVQATIGGSVAPDYIENAEVELFSPPASVNSIYTVYSPEEACYLTSAKSTALGYPCCQVPILGGMVGNLMNDAALRSIQGVSWNTSSCARNIAKQTGDATVYYDIMQRRPNGLIDMVSNANGKIIEQRPLSGVDYIETKATAVANLGEVKALYYPGTGYDLLQPVQGFWGWSVNVVFGFLTVLIIIVAFGIMFRSNLGGSQVVTLQNSIPSIALAMILVPLSYAISGLFIDGITLGTNVVHQFLLGEGSPARNVYDNRNDDFPLGNVVDKLDSTDRELFPDDSRVSWLLSWRHVNVSTEFDNLVDSTIHNTGTADVGGKEVGINKVIDLTDMLIDFIDDDEDTASWIGTIINFILSLALLVTAFRIFFILLKKFIVLILYPIISPFVFATMALPGRGTATIWSYINTMTSAAATFVAAYGLILFSMILSSDTFNRTIADINSVEYIPPLLAIDPIIRGVNDNQFDFNSFIFIILALGLYIQIPTMLSELDTIFKVQPMPKFIGQAAATLRADLQTVRNTPGEARRRSWQAADAFDTRVRGVKPDQYGSLRSIVGRRVSGLGARADILRDRGGLVGNVAGRALGGVATASRNIAGPEVTQQGNRDARGLEATVEIVFNGRKGDGELILKKSEVESFCRRYEAEFQAAGNINDVNRTLAKGTITLTAKDWKMPVQISAETIRVRSVVLQGSTTAGRRAGPTVRGIIANGLDIWDLGPATAGTLTTALSLNAGFVYTDNGNKAELDFTINVESIEQAFGYQGVPGAPGTGTINDAARSWINLRGGGARSDKLYFTIDQVTTAKPVGFAISMTG